MDQHPLDKHTPQDNLSLRISINIGYKGGHEIQGDDVDLYLQGTCECGHYCIALIGVYVMPFVTEFKVTKEGDLLQDTYAKIRQFERGMLQAIRDHEVKAISFIPVTGRPGASQRD